METSSCKTKLCTVQVALFVHLYNQLSPPETPITVTAKLGLFMKLFDRLGLKKSVASACSIANA